jgi:D-glycero-D-manno-heptose 1,7-bisphosphate phosphatase
MRHNYGSNSTPLSREWAPDALEAIRVATTASWHVFVIADQADFAGAPGSEAAFAAPDEDKIDQVRTAGGTIDDLRCRIDDAQANIRTSREVGAQPGAASRMILDLIQAWQLDPQRCILVGDLATDRETAASSGIKACQVPVGRLLDTVLALLDGSPSVRGGSTLSRESP